MHISYKPNHALLISHSLQKNLRFFFRFKMRNKLDIELKMYLNLKVIKIRNKKNVHKFTILIYKQTKALEIIMGRILSTIAGE